MPVIVNFESPNVPRKEDNTISKKLKYRSPKATNKMDVFLKMVTMEMAQCSRHFEPAKRDRKPSQNLVSAKKAKVNKTNTA
ncbi:hypothetical protein DI09_397p10 [Mitosporidium daphniae]|uniref:Uncharacterized protein n=1 Tax=Mitosporidium daphniae TaxID=1485682 RepID=A0A098VQN5_9MICR|nr:uncharacterized protein DI09_397p10 [Mitosporidium daphniae]KGG51328.1 hypothetical protein DI09_397p10 [Mitosporidium daphniae]|eukprot:XP_013237764.1 uncharacterized protein DI09_397p10 [Mitosporidium daphniae]